MGWKILLISIAENKEKGTRYAFLLGAGASISSGIPGAKDLATRWLKQIEEDDIEEYQRLTQLPDYKQGDIAALYSEVYRTRFPIVGDDYRAI